MKIACLLGDGFEDSEFQKPYDAYREAGHDVRIIGVEAGTELKGKKGSVSTKSEAAIADVSPSDFDALFIPGGYSPDHIRANDRMVDFAGAFMRMDRPVFAICHGPQLLISADAVRGRRMTAWKTVQGDLRLAGAEVVDEEVCVDGTLVTSRKPDDIPAFNRESLALLQRQPTGVS
jgi:protease I